MSVCSKAARWDSSPCLEMLSTQIPFSRKCFGVAGRQRGGVQPLGGASSSVACEDARPPIFSLFLDWWFWG